MGFWDKRMSGEAPAPQPPAPVGRQFNPDLLPRGMGRDPAGAAQHYMSQQPMQQVDDVEVPPGHIDAGTAIHNWKGDRLRGAQKENASTSCPACGSFRYLVPANSGKVTQNGTVYPARFCGECGFNESRPDQGVIGTAAKTVGAVRTARQGDSPGWNPEPIASGL